MTKVSAQAEYLSKRIISNKLTYERCVTSRPDLKNEIDIYLTERGYTNLIVAV